MVHAEGHKRFTVNGRQEFDGTYIADVAELQGCFAAGATVEQAMQVLCEVLPIYLEDVQGVQGANILDVEPIEGPGPLENESVIARRELILAN